MRKLLGGLAFVALFGVLGVQAQKCKPAGTPCDPQGPSWQCCTGVCTNGGVCGLRQQDEGDDRACRPPGARCGPNLPRSCEGGCGRDRVCPGGKDGNGAICLQPGEKCRIGGVSCCKGICALNRKCIGFVPHGSYDLQPQDLNALCPKVDRNYRAPSDCVYMKWVSCPGVQSDPNRPCGWYQQAKCSDNDNGGPNKPNVPQPRFLDFERDRKKRSADEEQQDEEVENGPVFISFQE